MAHRRRRIAGIEVARRQSEPQRGAVAAFGEQRFEIGDEIVRHGRSIVRRTAAPTAGVSVKKGGVASHSAAAERAAYSAAPRHRLKEHDHEANRTARLPQLDGGWFLTDAGLETVLIFQEGIALPEFAAFVLLQSQRRAASDLRRYFRRFLELAAATPGAGFILESPTWRAGFDWGAKLGFDARGHAAASIATRSP